MLQGLIRYLYEMPAFNSYDLENNYSWTRTLKDDLKLSGEPDGSEFDNKEGNEMLYMINKLMKNLNVTRVLDGQKLERMLTLYPANYRTQAHVEKWVIDNWGRYDAHA